MSIDTTDLTPAQQDAVEQDDWSPSDEDWQWFLSETYVDPAERIC